MENTRTNWKRVKLNRENEETYINVYNHFIGTPCKTIRKRGKNNILYLTNFMTFDSETSWNRDIDDPIAWVYQWAFEFNGQVVEGRQITDFISELLKIEEYYNLDCNKKLLIYVHNLSFDATFFLDYLEQISHVKLLALDTHKILSINWRGFEFRCSYLLSNMSLDKFSKFENTNTRKAVGSVDYSIIRYPDTPLSEIDDFYMINDIISLKEAIENKMLSDCDTVTTIPLTSTGYVRRDVRNSCRTANYRKYFLKTRLTVDTYKMCKQAFMGGLCHGNRFYSGKTVKGIIGHWDFKSHYPSIQQMRYFPQEFRLYYDCEINNINLKREKLDELCNTYCCLFKCILTNVKLKKGVTCPYISESKIMNKNFTPMTDKGVKGTDNGRIINIKDGVGIILTLTELDYDIIKSQYDFDIFIYKLYISKRVTFPENILSVIDDFFFIKETEQDKYYRTKSKNKINSIYGMTATDIIRDNIIYDFNSMEWDRIKHFDNDKVIEERLNKYYNSRNNFNPYQLGVYTTAWARWLLIHIIRDVVGYENFLYCDTDSVFFIENNDIIKRLEQYNDNVRNEYNKYIIANDKKVYYGTMEDEKEDIKAFRFLHAKCYAFIDGEDALNVTISGVTKDNKKLDGERVTIAQELGDIENLTEDFTFIECGGTRSIYTSFKPTVSVIDGHTIHHASGCILVNVTKKLSGLESYEIYAEAMG